MAPQPRPEGGRRSLIVLIRTVQQALRSELDAALREVELTLPQLAALAALSQSPGASNAELARAAFITPQSMGEVLVSLLEGGFVERKPDPDNARVLRATLTPAGLRMLGRGGKAASQVEARLVAALTAEEQRILRAALERCLSALTSRHEAGN